MIDGFVLAGGRSRRMGVDKARLPGPDRWPLAVSVASALRAAGGRVALVRRQEEEPWATPWGTPLPVVVEADDVAHHPLWGIATACRCGRTPFVAVAPCDLPGLDEAAVRRLVEALPVGGASGPAVPVERASGAVVAEGGDGLHPLLAVVPRALGPLAARAAASGASARRFLADARRVRLPAEVLRNVNRWSDVGRPHPLEAVGSLPGVGPEAIAAEERRLAARGCVVPPRPAGHRSGAAG